MNKTISRFSVFAVACLLLSGCASTSMSSEESVSAPESNQSNSSIESSGSENLTTDLPAEWSSDEIQIWNLFSQIHPEVKIISDVGKRALIASTHNICEAYDEGYSRIEISSVMSSNGTSNAEFNDDLMTLSVTYFCPQHMSEQVN